MSLWHATNCMVAVNHPLQQGPPNSKSEVPLSSKSWGFHRFILGVFILKAAMNISKGHLEAMRTQTRHSLQTMLFRCSPLPKLWKIHLGRPSPREHVRLVGGWAAGWHGRMCVVVPGDRVTAVSWSPRPRVCWRWTLRCSGRRSWC